MWLLDTADSPISQMRLVSGQVKTRANYSTLFHLSNVLLLLFGLYLWITYSIYRIVVLYSLFNAILFWLTNAGREKALCNCVATSWVPRCAAVCAVVSFVSMIVISSQGLYTRPSVVSPLMGLVLLFLIVQSLTSRNVTDRPFFQKQSFFLPLLTSTILFTAFSVYFIQPDLMNAPAYAVVDAYRDYANANRILTLSKIEPGKLILQRYYRAFPILPLELACISLITALPTNIGHLALSMVCETVGVVSLVLLSKAIINSRQPAAFPSVTILSILIVLLQPSLVEPTSLLPIRVSIPILTLIFYLAYARKIASPTLARHVIISIMLLAFVIIPLHAASAVFLILLFCVGFLTNRVRTPRLLAVICSVGFGMYLTFSAGTPLVPVIEAMKLIYLALNEILVHGPSSIIAQIDVASMAAKTLTEADLFLLSVGPALTFSIFTVFLLRAVKDRGIRANLHSSDFWFGGLTALAFGGGYILSRWRTLDYRYFVHPLTPLALAVTTMVLLRVLRNPGTTRKLMLFGVLALYTVSVIASPVFLHESHPSNARMLPIESEKAAAMFVSTSFDFDGMRVNQIVTDWPFSAHVRGLLSSRHIDLEHKVNVVEIMFEPIAIGQETILLSRKYFMGNVYLRSISPYVEHLVEVEHTQVLGLNKILDVDSASVYLGILR